MCGVAGFLWKNTPDVIDRVVCSMVRSLRHRGPDAEDAWVDAETGVALGHARLSVIDLSDNGSQPMVSSSQRYVIVYNGEIYDYGNLADKLTQAEVAFRGGFRY
jgi:asparagine synthase (glutamine-hydrolysing)